MIKISVKANCALALELEPLTSGMVGVPISFSFGPEWDGLVKTVCFINGDTELPSVTLKGNSMEIPAEALANPNTVLKVGVYGETLDGQLIIPTMYTSLGTVHQGAKKTGRPPVPPTPDWTTGIESDVNRAVEVAESVKRRADACEFNGESAYMLAVKKGIRRY